MIKAWSVGRLVLFVIAGSRLKCMLFIDESLVKLVILRAVLSSIIPTTVLFFFTCETDHASLLPCYSQVCAILVAYFDLRSPSRSRDSQSPSWDTCGPFEESRELQQLNLCHISSLPCTL